MKEIAEKNIQIALKKLGSDHAITGNAYNSLGNYFQSMNKIDSAIFFFKKAFAIYLKTYDSNDPRIACSYLNIGMMYSEKSDFSLAEDYYNRSLEIYKEKFGETCEEVANCYNSLGVLKYYQGDLDASKDYFERMLKIRIELLGPDHPDVASCYNNLGVISMAAARYDEAIENHSKALEIRLKKLGLKHPNVALSYNNLANAYSSKGYYKLSDQYHQKALKIRKEIYDEDHLDIAMSYTNLGSNCIDAGLYEEALDYFTKAKKIIVATFGENNPRVSSAYNNMGVAFAKLGDFEKTMECLYKALELRKKDGENNYGVANSYSNIASIYTFKGDYDLALSFCNRSLLIMGGDTVIHPQVSSTINNMGSIYQDKEDYEKALKCYLKSLEIDEKVHGKKHPDLAGQYRNIGSVYGELKEYHKEFEYYKIALSLLKESFGLYHPEIASLFKNIALNQLHLSNYDEALKSVNQSIAIVDSVLPKKHSICANVIAVKGEIYSELNIFDSALYYYNKALNANYYGEFDPIKGVDHKVIFNELAFIDVLMKKAGTCYRMYEISGNMKNLNSAFQSYKNAISLILQLNDSYLLDDTRIRNLNKLADNLLYAIETSYLLYKNTNDLKYLESAFNFSEFNKALVLQGSILRSGINIAGGDSRQQVNKTLALYNILKTKLINSLQNGDEEETMHFQSKIDSLVIRLNKLKSNDNENNLHDWYIGASVSSFFEKIDSTTCFMEYFVTDSVFFVFLLKNKQIEVVRNEFNKNLTTEVNELLKLLKKNRITEFEQSSYFLYNELFKPLERYLTGIERVIIIPDKALLFLPFDILVSDLNKPNRPEYLIEKYTISYHYSGHLFYLTSTIDKNRYAITKMEFTGFAPVFREGNLIARVDENNNFLDRSLNDTILRSITKNNREYNPLPYTETEVNTIVNLFESAGKKATAFYYSDASEKNFVDALSSSKYIHVATHGIMNNVHPELSGLVFSQSATSRDHASGIPDTLSLKGLNDGLLYVSEIYNQKCNADLIVLSACETGTGKLERGEGVLSLTRGFLYAGVPNIVYSCWKVGDKSTGILMYNFYTNLVNGDNYPVSLRKAKLSMLKNEETAFPRFWGGFSFIGY